MNETSQWPFMPVPVNGWKCAVCGYFVLAVWDQQKQFWVPESNYWNVERREMYCCAEHSLKRHEALRAQT